MKALLLSLLFVIGGCSIAPVDQITTSPRATVYQIQNARGTGSGVLIEEGVMLTAAHVAMHEELRVEIGDVVHKATVIKMFPEKDLALVSIRTLHCPCAPIAHSVSVDEKVKAIGYPLGMVKASTDGAYQGIEKSGSYGVFTTSIAPGNSGGGIFNAKGELVGVSVAVPTIPLNMFSFDLALWMAMSPTLKDIQAFAKR